MPRRASRLMLAVLVPVVLAGCTAGPSTRPPVVENDGPPPQRQSAPPSEVPLPELEESRGSSIDWSDCPQQTLSELPGTAADTADVSCARITTTLDAPDLPRRGLTRIALLKVGSGPVPLAVVNDIGGEPGTVYAARLAASLPSEVLERFSLIGVDRRGTGESDAARCIPADVRADLLGQDPGGDIEPVLDAARTAGQQCAINLEDEQEALDTWRAAGDLDELRQQLEVGHLNAIGHGEGSKVVAVYGARFPDRAGRFVLDGVPDPAEDMVTLLDGIAGGAEATLDAFGEDCANRGCALGSDARGAVISLVDASRSAPVRAKDSASLGPALVLRAVHAGLAQPDRWPELADAIDTARGGDGTALAAFVNPLLVETRETAARLDGALATLCNDTATRLPADQLQRASDDLGGKHPVFGALLAQELAWCSPWPSKREPPPDIGAPGTPPMVIVSTATDPVTPEQGTIRATEQIPSGVRIAWQGAGHGALGSACVGDAVRAFLIEGTVPKDGTLCPA